MKKVFFLILAVLLAIGLFFPAGTDKNTVLMEAPLVYEHKFSEDDALQKQTLQKEAVVVLEEEKQITEQTSSQLTEEKKADLLRSQQDFYAFSSLSVMEQNLYVEILYALENRVEEMELSTKDPEEIDFIFQCVLMDHPEIFYADGYSFVKYTYGDEIRKVTFSGNFLFSEEEILDRQEKIKVAAREILSKIPQEASDYEKVKRVYEEIINYTEYSMNAQDNQNICSVFLGRKSVCQGYAKAVQYLLNHLSVPTTLVVGTVENGEGHAWNLVRIDNQYYHVDATWGDASYLVEQKNEGIPGINYDYLCITSEEIQRTHSIDSVVPLPVCNAKEANYYVMEGAYFTEFEEEKLRQLIEEYKNRGQENVTIKCDSMETYQEMVEKLIEEQKIFLYLDTRENSIMYTESKEQLSLTFWILQEGK